MNGELQTAVVFDFDGTLVDSLPLVLNLLYELAHNRPLPDEDMSRLRDMTMAQILSELRIPWWRALFLMRRIRKMMRSRMGEIVIMPGLADAIKVLHKRYKLFVLSSNDSENVRIFLRRSNLEAYFVNVYGGANVLYKERKLRKLMHQNGLQPGQTWYVCDESRDIIATRRVGMRSAAVSWGYSNIHRLEAQHPDALVFNSDELIRCIFNNVKSHEV